MLCIGVHFAPSRSELLYHTDQAWSGALDIPMGGRNTRVVLGFAFGNDDHLIEEYGGIGFRIESRKLGTRRLGMSFELSEDGLDVAAIRTRIFALSVSDRTSPAAGTVSRRLP